MLLRKLDNPFLLDRLDHIEDFRAEWDVPTLGKQFTDECFHAINEVRQHPDLHPSRKVMAVVGPAGYGKTHLFGRLNFQQGEGVQIAFLAAPPGIDGIDKNKHVESVLRWRLVDSLLYSVKSVAPFRLVLAPSGTVLLGLF